MDYDKINEMSREEILRRFEEQRKGNPFDVPESLDELEILIGWFWDRIRIIVSVENHILKFDGPKQVLKILEKSANEVGVTMVFAYSNGQWWILDVKEPEDVLNLPKVAKRFAQIYRHEAQKYETGENAAYDAKRLGKADRSD